MNVLSSLNLDPATLAVYQDMADILSGVATFPNDRTNFFSAVTNAGYTVTSWFGSINQLADDGNGGYLVNVLVAPEITNPNSPSPFIMTLYSEQWDIDANGNPTFVQSFDPDNVSGQMPDLIAN